MNDDIEAELVTKAKSGDPSAAPFLVSFCGERLLGYARSHAPDLSDSDREQIVELAIEAGVRAIAKFDPDSGTLFSWFRTQVRFKTLGWRRAIPATDALPDEIEQPEPLPCDSPRAGALRRAIARLGRPDQVILALRSGERIDYREIAQRLDITEAAARQRHSRALKRLLIEAIKEPDLQDLAQSEVDA